MRVYQVLGRPWLLLAAAAFVFVEAQLPTLIDPLWELALDYAYNVKKAKPDVIQRIKVRRIPLVL